jgi:hypothetical protein
MADSLIVRVELWGGPLDGAVIEVLRGTKVWMNSDYSRYVSCSDGRLHYRGVAKGADRPR